MLMGVSAQRKTNIQLGVEVITAIDDGGMSLSPNKKANILPVLSIEVPTFISRCQANQSTQAKRKKHKKRSGLETLYSHAAQIYCENVRTCFVIHLFSKILTLRFKRFNIFLLFLISAGFLSLMEDMLHFISFTRAFQINIYAISPATLQNIQIFHASHLRSRSTNHALIGCVNHMIKLHSSIIWSVKRVTLGTFVIILEIHLYLYL